MRLVTVKLSEEEMKKIEELVNTRTHTPSWLRAAAIRSFVKDMTEDCPKSSLEKEPADRRIRQRLHNKSLILRFEENFDKRKLSLILEDSGYPLSLEILSIDIEMCNRCIFPKDDRVCIYQPQIFDIYVYWRFYGKIPKRKELNQFRNRLQLAKRIKDSRMDGCYFFFP